MSFHAERFDTQGRPGLHALLVGISAYPYLRPPADPCLEEPPPVTFGLTQITSAALTAYTIYRWLKSPGLAASGGPIPGAPTHELAMPLASIRLLVAPSAVELAAEPDLAVVASPCTLRDFQVAAREWREDASTFKNNVTFFYFAGHGVQRPATGAIMLLADFGDGLGDVLQNAIDVTTLRHGMRPTDVSRPSIARTQLYFVDACRDLPPDLHALEQRAPSAAFPIDLESGTDDRCAPVFYAAVPGSQARAFPGVQTVFGQALLECFNGAASDRQRQKWTVTVFTLVPGLRARVDRLSRDLQRTIDYVVDGSGKDAPIVRLNQPPTVDVSVEVAPCDAHQVARVKLERLNVKHVWELPEPPIAPHPYPGQLPSGFYRLSWQIVGSPGHPEWEDGTEMIEVKPLNSTIVVSVCAGRGVA